MSATCKLYWRGLPVVLFIKNNMKAKGKTNSMSASLLRDIRGSAAFLSMLGIR